MNNYIFLTNSIRNIGGSQLYVSRKVDWLKKQGWSVHVFYYNPGNIVIENLREYAENYVQELSLPIRIVSERIKKKVASRVCCNVTKEGNIIIECHEINLCIWGEYLGNIMGGMTLCYPLSETFPRLKTDEKNYFEHKLKNNLLFGITNQSIPALMGKNKLSENRGLYAVGCLENNVTDQTDFKLEIKENSTSILLIGRLDKPYVQPVLGGLKGFCAMHKDMDFNIILLGDSADHRIRESIVGNMSVESNIHICCTGYINPIPRKLLQQCDVAIASSGCVLVSAMENVLTIAVDGNDYKAIGIYGITTNNTVFRESEPAVDIVELLEDILIEKKYNKTNIQVNKITTLDYSKHLEIINNYRPNDKFNFSFKPTLKNRIRSFLLNLLGTDRYIKLFN